MTKREQLLVDAIVNLVSVYNGLDIEVNSTQEMQEAIDKGVKFEDIVKEYKNIQDVNTLSDREVLASKFKESYKDWSDEKINEVLNKMENSGLIEIEAGRL